MLGLARLLIAAFCVLFIGGAVAIFVNAPEAWVVAVLLILTALGGFAALVLERTRYRSVRAEPPPGQARSPGGDRPDQPMGRTFEATDEIFMDPTTGRRMRVFLDPSSGERRYRPEG
jgi:hypothetical protein